MSRVHGSLLLSIPREFFLLLSFYIVISWYMSLFEAWSENKLNKKFVVAENFADLFSKVSDSLYFQRKAILFSLEGGKFDPL